MQFNEFRQQPRWARDALQQSAGTFAVQNGIARVIREQGVLILQFLYRSKRSRATVIQYPVASLADAYAKLAVEFPPRDHIAYYLIATAPALRAAEASGITYVRAFSGVPGGGAVLLAPADIWTEKADA
ncbi:hypothetical protein [Streptomyces scabiei]|uniref:hypothetical protein n=1 Tax=Streptomyces scabiei TaxID=1930 RepID=UPI0029A390AD|nr:hypothetical protein [Streptomyces scabiei]MDX3522055.1 hypothetical protein [Streptomyces scabiei]